MDKIINNFFLFSIVHFAFLVSNTMAAGTDFMDSSATILPSGFNGYGLQYGKTFFDEIFYEEDLNWRNSGFYIVLNEHKWDDFLGLNVGFLPLESNDVIVFHVPSIPFQPGPDAHVWLGCVEKTIQNHHQKLLDQCKKNLTAPQKIKNLLKIFFMENRPGMGNNSLCASSMNIVYVNEQTERFFLDLVNPECYENGLKKYPFWGEYSTLYMLVKKLIDLNFDECKWNKIDNMDEINRNCIEQ